MEPGNTMNTQKRKPNSNLLKYQESNRESFISCSSALIVHTLRMVTEHENQGNNSLCDYMDEMLHSIFFLAYIHDRSLTPSKHFKSSKLCDVVKKKFPGSFEKYRSHLPTRTPFSILLNMMETLYHTEEEIKVELLILLQELNFPYPLHKPGSKHEQYYTLESTVICVCSDSGSNSDSTPQTYFGASLSCRKGNAKRILIDVSCLKTWHEFVSHAVMSFTLEGSGDGITFPESVKCQAYIRDWNENVYKERRPCLNCGELFNLNDADPDKVHHPYGNCAETECLSKLLFNNQHTRKNTRIENHTEETLETLRRRTKESLTKQLAQVGIKIINENFLFYSPMQKS
ncbi:uncharacterized protein Hap1MRO34_002600 [Clarias gariepinus]|uniref:uncharacterized protein LOC128515872 n=1 Tax=Clarias gariepinus TaxID=13013 RepID=UPI00234E1055|nr:uncharacterized protein LOC128515872 [Clarias gariepinus]